MIGFILNPFLTLPSQPSTELYNPKWITNECVLCVCRFGISFTYMIEDIESKLISVCLINDYSLIANLHIFVSGRAELSSISFECTKVKLLILNNFGFSQANNHLARKKDLTMVLLSIVTLIADHNASDTSLYLGGH